MRYKAKWQHLILIILLGFIVYVNVLNSEFVYDDVVFICRNDFIKDLRNLPLLAKPGKYFEGAKERGYWPVVTLLYMTSYSLWGLNVAFYHLTNIFFHILASLLVYLIILKGSGKEKIALFSALVFAVHPVHTESVTWIPGRTDLLSTFFFLISFFLYTAFVAAKDRGRTYHYAASLGCFMISLFAKEMAITLPFVIVLYDVSFAKREERRGAYYIAYFLIAIFYVIMRVTVYNVGNSAAKLSFDAYPGGSPVTTILTMARAVIFYIRVLFIPTGLCLDRMFPVSKSVLEPSVIAALLILMGVVAATVRAYKESKAVFFSAVFFFLTVLPVSNMIPIPHLLPDAVVSERYMYLPSIGFCILAGICMDRIYSSSRNMGIATTVLILTSYSILTVARNSDWKDGLTLWSNTLKQSPRNYRARYNLGLAYGRRGMWDEAARSFEEALRLKPDYDEVYCDLGLAYIKLSQYERGIELFKKTIDMKPDYALAYYNLGLACGNLGRYEEAVSSFRQAAALDPADEKAYCNLGVTYVELGRYEEGIRAFKEAIRINPYDIRTQCNLGVAYLKIGDKDSAGEQYRILKNLDRGKADELLELIGK